MTNSDPSSALSLSLSSSAPRVPPSLPIPAISSIREESKQGNEQKSDESPSLSIDSDNLVKELSENECENSSSSEEEFTLEFEQLTLDLPYDNGHEGIAGKIIKFNEYFTFSRIFSFIHHLLTGSKDERIAVSLSSPDSQSILEFENSKKNQEEKVENKENNENAPEYCVDQPGLSSEKLPRVFSFVSPVDSNGVGMKRILDNINAKIRKGKLTIIIGGSGAGNYNKLNLSYKCKISGTNCLLFCFVVCLGKSTLLKLVAGRSFSSSSHHFTGRFRLFGREVTSNELSCTAGFCMQDDCFLPLLTVLETLTFKARLRNSPILDQRQIEENCKKILQQLGLEKVTNSFVGTIASGGGTDESAGSGGISKSSFIGKLLKFFQMTDAHDGKGLSGGEQRRLSIGLELIQSNKLLLLDECTSK
jgi:ABC-type nitrate/sulfonate/bicarbonate transport system ATPase subunit